MRLREPHSASREAAGSRTLMRQLRKAGIPIGRWKRVRSDKPSTGGGPRYRICAEELVASPNRVRREFTPREPNILWFGDISYIRTGKGGVTWRWSWICIHVVLSVGRCHQQQTPLWFVGHCVMHWRYAGRKSE
nr:hypothetical protein [Photorhabdus tasmaniensis]